MQRLLIVAVISLFPVNAVALTRDITAVWQYPDIENIAGFRLYQENNVVCSTTNPQATFMNCTIDTPDGESWFTLTVIFEDGTESPHSETLTYIFSSGLKAQFTSSLVGGESPLLISFDAAGSSGDIISYEWMFGDGDSAVGRNASHTFLSAGAYTVTLRVVDDLGAYDQETLTVVVTSPEVLNSPPTAVIASSSTVGRAPLPVQFDGSSSSDSDGTILSFAWAFGDGGTSSVPSVRYIYMSGGTFYSSLTVTDNGGLNNRVSTPVIVQPSLSGNIPPVAVISASAKNGEVPLTITFSGSNSDDPDGNITEYSWNFGDGAVGTGIAVRHTFSQAALYSITLQVTDDKGAVSQRAVFLVKAKKGELSDTQKIANIHIINLLLSNQSTSTQANEKQ